MKGLRVVVAEDSALLREGLRHILADAGHEVVAGAGDAAELLDAVAAHAPDLVVTDVRMPPAFTDEGLAAAVELRRRHPGLPIVVLSHVVGRTYAAELLETATTAVGYLLKDRVADVPQFVAAVERVAGGAVVIDPEVVRRLLAARRDASPLAALTPRETDVLEGMAQGRTNGAIASALRISEISVAKHAGNIFAKLLLPPAADDNRRVLAVLAYLRDRPDGTGLT
ncbi:response regulator transcription factor [Pseudonocardia sp. TRM90224]|uniref:response regulator transcription factor n=1 Tax=Pseudonocardia sp. TRM90224 TaxID=2812678 RepID=UPI001E2AB526|nr:response regulator transcription factor [Pseudonocardia sp. TRM90224]